MYLEENLVLDHILNKKEKQMTKKFILLSIDMSSSLSGIEEHTNGIVTIKDTMDEMDIYVKENKIVLDTEIHLYHNNYEAYTVVSY